MICRGWAAARPWVLAGCLVPTGAGGIDGQRDPFQPAAAASRPAEREAIMGWVADNERRQLLTLDGQGHWRLREAVPNGGQGGWTIATVTEQKEDDS